MADDAFLTFDLEGGSEVIEQLAREGFPLKAAAWVHTNDESWRLNLVAPIRNSDLLEAYRRASKAILADPEQKDRLKQISFTIVDTRAPLGRKLVEWSKKTDGRYRRVSSVSPDGGLIDAVVYGQAA
jgi:hypothetical protein